MAQDGNGNSGTAKYPTPPYIAYKTFGTLLGDLKEHGLPPVIDRSVLTRFSGGVAGQILSALTSLGLMDGKKHPTPALRELVDAHDTADFKPKMRALVERNYPYVLALSLENATPSMFADAFRSNLGAKEEVLRKCRTFFLHAARDVDIPIGARIENAKFPRTRVLRGKKKEAAPASTPSSEGGVTPPSTPASDTGGVVAQLLGKFPDFDPSWPDEIKAKWFEGFDKFMSGVQVKGG